MTGKYRRINEPCNTGCNQCRKPIWVRQGIYTIYNGYEHWANYHTMVPESYTVVDNNGNINNLCYYCYHEYYGEKKNENT